MFVTEDPTRKDLSQFQLPWESLEALLQGKSAIDLAALPVQDREEAFDMVYNYGFDLNRDDDAQEIQGYLVEAIHFIERRFLTADTDWAALGEPLPPAEKIPEEVIASRDVLDLILLASDAENPLRPWACALLKVMHTLVYIHNSPLYKYQSQASETILQRFQKVLRQDGDGSYVLVGRDRELRLHGFETKPQKPRESILVKLLCKKEHVAEDVWDLVGIRLITRHPAEAVLALDLLREQKVILLPNVIPSRTRNTLVDFDRFRLQYEEALHEYKLGERTLDEMKRIFETLPMSSPESADFSYNPISSPLYRSLHITCRQLLRVRPPGAMRDKAMEMRFAFPYEIQIQDQESHQENRDGHSAHALYKQRQLLAARRRVMGSLLKDPVASPEPEAV